jgi:hypothetical protein
LGCGCTALAGIVAHKCNADMVLLTDKRHINDEFQSMINFNLALNACRGSSEAIRFMDLNWGVLEQGLCTNIPKIDFVVGADVFFESTREFRN